VNVVSPSVVTNGSIITAVWNDFTNGDGIALGEVQTSFSTNGGNTWSTPLTISTANASDPEIVLDGNNISAIWGAPDGITVANSTDNGATWSTPVIISGAMPITNGQTATPQLVRDGARVVALWSADGVVESATSTDGGASWGAVTSFGLGSSTNLSSDGLVIGATWVAGDQHIWASASTDGGVSWGAPSDVSGAGATTTPRVVVAGTRLTLAWTDTSGAIDVIFTAYSANAGASWSAPAARTSATNADSPRIVTGGSRTTIIWRQHNGTSFRTTTASSSDGGATWSTPVDISTPGVHNTEGYGYPLGGPEIVSDGTTLSATWSESTGGSYQTVFSSSTNGTTWSTPTILDAAGSILQTAPRLTTDGTNVTVVWIDATRGVSVTSYELTDTCSTNPPGQLARTGVATELPLLTALALLVIGGALFARKRVRITH
jgi:hypothetical protein